MRIPRHHWIPAALALLALSVFAGALQNDFVNWDDDKYVTKNELIQRLDAQSLSEIFTVVYFHTWEPVKILSYAIDYAIWGLRPFGYHLTNCLLHALCTVLLYLLLCRILGRGDPGSARAPSALAAALFAIHPVQVESVAWISERKNVLGMALFLAAFLAWLRATRAHVRPGTYVAFLALFAAALMTKLHAVILPPFLVLYEWIENPARPDARPSRVKRTALLVPAFGMALAIGLIRLKVGDVGEHTRPTGDLLGATATAPTLVLAYARDLLFPMNRAALFFPTVYQSLWDLPSLAAWVLVGCWGLAVSANRRVRPHVSFFSLWFLCALLPVLNFVPVSIMAADRYQYWAAPGLFALAGLGASSLWYRLAPQRKPFAAGLALLMGAMLVAGTLSRVAVWKDGVSLWTDAVRKLPDYEQPRQNLASALMELGKEGEAQQVLREATELNPGDISSRIALAISLSNQGRMEEAEQELREAVRWSPEHAAARAKLGSVLLKSNQFAEAEQHLREAVRLRPEAEMVHGDLGLVLMRLGKPAEAEQHFREAVRIKPFSAEMRGNLGLLLLNLGRAKEAESEFREVLRIQPENVNARNYLGVTLLGLGKPAEAEQELREGLRLDPDNLGVRINLAGVLLGLGKFNEAEGEIRAAMRLDPGNTIARRVLIRSLLQLGKLDEAETEILKALRIDPRGIRENYDLARLAARRGDREKTFDALNRLYSSGFRDAEGLRKDPDLAFILDDPRITALLAKMGEEM